MSFSDLLLKLISPFAEVEIEREIILEATKRKDGITLLINGERLDENSEEGKHIIRHLNEAATLSGDQGALETYMEKFGKELSHIFK